VATPAAPAKPAEGTPAENMLIVHTNMPTGKLFAVATSKTDVVEYGWADFWGDPPTRVILDMQQVVSEYEVPFTTLDPGNYLFGKSTTKGKDHR
jgi:hypothetical protein